MSFISSEIEQTLSIETNGQNLEVGCRTWKLGGRMGERFRVVQGYSHVVCTGSHVGSPSRVVCAGLRLNGASRWLVAVAKTWKLSFVDCPIKATYNPGLQTTRSLGRVVGDVTEYDVISCDFFFDCIFLPISPLSRLCVANNRSREISVQS